LILAILLLGQWGQLFKLRDWQQSGQADGDERQLHEHVYANFIRNEDRRVELGCGMISTGCCILGVLIKRSARSPEKVKVTEKWSIATGYNPGICWIGHYFDRYPGYPDPQQLLYWLNSVEISIGYRIGHRYKLVMGSGYLWRWKYLQWDYSNDFSYVEKGIWGIPVYLGLEKSFWKKVAHFYRLQVEYYLWKYSCKEAELVQGGGVSYAFGIRLRIRNTLMLELSPSFRLGFVKEYKGYRWEPPLEWYPSGIYFKVGLFSPLGRRCEGGE